MSSPNAVTAAIPCIDLDENLDQWDLAIAYLIDIEARARRFQAQYPNLKTYEVRLETLSDLTQVISFFKKMNLTPTEATEAMYSKKINQRAIVKQKYSGGQDISLAYCQARIEQYIKKAQALNIPIPDTLALDAEVQLSKS